MSAQPGAEPVAEPRAVPGVAHGRFTALDGLRGLAALVVVVHHVMLVVPPFGRQFPDRPTSTADRWLEFSPLHVFWAGGEAVSVFFVLSGFVLTLLFDRPTPSTWRAYYPRRLLRLYPPAWAALALALLTYAVVPHSAPAHASWWVADHDVTVTWARALRDAALVTGTSAYDGPLWSLRWEVVFSLAFPLYLLVGRRLGRWWPVGVLASAGAVAVGVHEGSEHLTYLPVFLIGVLMALHRDELVARAAGWSRRRWLLLDAVALLLVTGDWTLRTLPGNIVLPTGGAALTVFLFLAQPGAVRLGGRPAVQWLATRSFSLYLVHEPIVVSCADALRTTNPLPVLLVSVPLSLGLAEVFFRAVERPSHRLASACGRLLDRPGRGAQRRPGLAGATG